MQSPHPHALLLMECGLGWPCLILQNGSWVNVNLICFQENVVLMNPSICAR